MRLDHAEHGAAILVGRHRAAETNAGFDARGGPDITGRVLPAFRRPVSRPAPPMSSGNRARLRGSLSPKPAAADAPISAITRRCRAAISAGIPTWNCSSFMTRHDLAWSPALSKPRYPGLSQRFAPERNADDVVAVGDRSPWPSCSGDWRNRSRFAGRSLTRSWSLNRETIGHRRKRFQVALAISI